MPLRKLHQKKTISIKNPFKTQLVVKRDIKLRNHKLRWFLCTSCRHTFKKELNEVPPLAAQIDCPECSAKVSTQSSSFGYVASVSVNQKLL